MSTADEDMRAFTRALFAPDPDSDDDRDRAPQPEPQDMAAYVRNLFDRALRD